MIRSLVAGRTRTAGSLRSTRDTVEASTPAVRGTAASVLVLVFVLTACARSVIQSSPSLAQGGRQAAQELKQALVPVKNYNTLLIMLRGYLDRLSVGAG